MGLSTTIDGYPDQSADEADVRAEPEPRDRPRLGAVNGITTRFDVIYRAAPRFSLVFREPRPTNILVLLL